MAVHLFPCGLFGLNLLRRDDDAVTSSSDLISLLLGAVRLVPVEEALSGLNAELTFLYPLGQRRRAVEGVAPGVQKLLVSVESTPSQPFRAVPSR